MISFIAQAVWLALSGRPWMSARISAGQVGASPDDGASDEEGADDGGTVGIVAIRR
jgi:hypothetical protein